MSAIGLGAMKCMAIKCVLCFLVVFYSLFFSKSGSSIEREGVKYYTTFAGYNLPLHLTEQISKGRALMMGTYYVGFFSPDGTLSQVEKYYQGNLFFRHEYSYHENGSLRRNCVTNADGHVTINHYDQSGKIIE